MYAWSAVDAVSVRSDNVHECADCWSDHPNGNWSTWPVVEVSGNPSRCAPRPGNYNNRQSVGLLSRSTSTRHVTYTTLTLRQSRLWAARWLRRISFLVLFGSSAVFCLTKRGLVVDEFVDSNFSLRLARIRCQSWISDSSSSRVVCWRLCTQSVSG